MWSAGHWDTSVWETVTCNKPRLLFSLWFGTRSAVLTKGSWSASGACGRKKPLLCKVRLFQPFSGSVMAGTLSVAMKLTEEVVRCKLQVRKVLLTRWFRVLWSGNGSEGTKCHPSPNSVINSTRFVLFFHSFNRYALGITLPTSGECAHGLRWRKQPRDNFTARTGC